MLRSSRFLLSLCMLAALPIAAQSPASAGASTGATDAVSCKELTTTRPHIGTSYKGRVKFEDYLLTARIPSGLTGWSGVAENAPFHGFTIFPGATSRSCIVFEVHLRVDDADAPSQPANAVPVTLGKASGWQVTGKSGGQANVKTVFSFANGGDTDDGQIVLVAPAAELQRLKPLYDAFVRSVRFGQR